MKVGEETVQLIRGLVPLGALALGLVLERIAPHARLRPEWRANLGLWLVGAVPVFATGLPGAAGLDARSPLAMLGAPFRRRAGER